MLDLEVFVIRDIRDSCLDNAFFYQNVHYTMLLTMFAAKDLPTSWTVHLIGFILQGSLAATYFCHQTEQLGVEVRSRHRKNGGELRNFKYQ